jgi:zinc transport system substrate-binding protein
VFHYFCFENRNKALLKDFARSAHGPVVKFYAALVALSLMMLCLCFSGCAGQKENPGSTLPDSRPLKVFCTIYPVYDFAKNVGKDKIDVYCLAPPGTEPHEWEPSPKDLAAIQKADLFVYCGAGMEGWIDKVLKVVTGPKLTVVDTSQGIPSLSGQEEESETENEEKNGEPVHEHNTARDPHIWVDPVNAMKMVENITVGMVQADPANKDFYETNAREYLNELEALNNAYRDSIARAAHKEFITSHAAFGYLAKRYGLNQVPIRGLSPEAEPTPARMAEVIKLVNEKKIRYIFFETLVSPKVSQIIAEEAGAETLVLNPVGGLTPDELNSGKNYLSVMRENLLNLQKALEVEP